jgi:DNA polymerase-3 subunit beta
MSEGLRFTVSRRDFAEASNQVAKVAATVTTLPVLKALRIESGENEVTLAASDLETGLRVRVPAKVHSPGALVVFAKTLSSIVSALPSGDIQVSAHGVHTELVCAGAEYRLDGIDETLFQALADPTPAAQVVTLPAGLLAAMIRQTEFAGSQESFHAQNAWAFMTKPGEVRCKSWGEIRLAYRIAPAEVDFVSETLIPLTSIRLLLTLLNEGEVQILIDRHQVTFRAASFEFSTRVIDGKMPEYEAKVLGRGQARDFITVDRRALSESLRRLKILGDRDSMYRCTWQFRADQLTIRQRSESGQAEERVQLAGAGPDCEFDINGAAVLDVLQSVDEPEVRLEKPEGRWPLIVWAGERMDWFALQQGLERQNG